MDITNFIKQIEQQHKEQDALYHEVALKYSLSDTVMWVLYILCRSEEPLTQQGLCQQGYLPKQTINSAVNSLVKKGMVQLEVIPGTRNQKKIVLTDEGKAFSEKTIHNLISAEKQAYKNLSDEEREIYLKLTSKITASLREEFKGL